jgi:hypothetical protein
MAADTGGEGYWLLGADGGVFAFGSAGFAGANTICNGRYADGGYLCSELVLAPSITGHGYWTVDDRIVLQQFGDAPKLINGEQFWPISAIAPTPTGQGLFMLRRDNGRVYTVGDARSEYPDALRFSLPMGATGLTATRTGGGYWIAGGDGAVFALGDAHFAGSMFARPLNQPIAGAASTVTGQGYWLVAADGGVFVFGDAKFYGSAVNTAHAGSIVGMARTTDGGGYWLASSNGGVYAFGDAPFFGSAQSLRLARPITAIAARS